MVDRMDFSRRDLSVDHSANTAAQPDLLKLHFNENALGMSPLAKAAIIENLDIGYLYPDPERDAVISAIAQLNGVAESQVSLGNGSSENIHAVVQMYLTQALKEGVDYQLITPTPTFNYPEYYATFLNVPVVKVPITASDLSIDIEQMKKAADDFDGISLFYIANPNNPTSTIVTPSVLREWVKNAPDNHYFLLDEAYAEYVTDPDFESAIEWVKQGLSDNIIVTRTFSKLYALAGFRMGYAIASQPVINQCESFMSVDNTNLGGAVAVIATLKDEHFVENSLAANAASRHLVENALNELGLDFVPSQANFIFHEIKGDVNEYRDRMLQHNIMVGREFLPLKGYNRLTLGTVEQMEEFIKVLKAFREKGWV